MRFKAHYAFAPDKLQKRAECINKCSRVSYLLKAPVDGQCILKQIHRYANLITLANTKINLSLPIKL